MIAKYFKHSDKDISIYTAYNYFPANKDDKPAEYIYIDEEDKIFNSSQRKEIAFYPPNLTKRYHWPFISLLCSPPLNHCVEGNPNDRSREPA